MAPNISKHFGAESPRMSCEECWVTLAEDDTSAVRALALAKCLRRVVTTRKIAVVICDDVSDAYRKVLYANFDQCLKLDMPCERNGTPLRFYAKVFCWGMPFMRKCIFLDNETMVLKNCDELFDYPGTSAYVNGHGPLDSSVLVFEPSYEDYLDLCTWIRSGKLHNVHGTKLDLQFGEWVMKRKRFSFLPKKYNVEIDLDNGNAVWNNSDLCIVRFGKYHPMDYLSNGALQDMALVEKALINYWMETYMQDVSSTLKNPLQLEIRTNKMHPLAFPSISQSILDGNKEPIAIIGMSCRFPQADSLSEYWNVLANGMDCIRKVPEHRWPSALTDDFREVQAGFLKCPVDQFDGKFFNISPFELAHTDPQQRFLLEVSWEALEHAGINPLGLAGSNTGVFVGTWTQDYRDLIKDVNGEFGDFHRTYMGNSLGGTSGRLSFLLGLQGPNIASESGCSSGMVAIYLACESLRKRRSDLALAAGANLLLHPFKTKHMINVASPDGRSKTFDEKADGFGRAEGVATLVLKRYSDAVKSGDNVIALIRGCGIAQEGTSRSYGTPTKEVQELAMQAALDDAGVSPSEVCYVEAHGTGTLIGDTTEVAAITNLYCKPGDRDMEEPLLIASGKTNIGHTESCSGLAGIIKVALAMEHETMPPHIHLHNLNPHINLDKVPLRIPTQLENWERVRGKPRLAGISSFGITGTNTHVILQEPPKYAPPKLQLSLEKERPLHIFTFSAKSEASLESVLDSYKEYFSGENADKVNLADVAYTLNTGRAHFTHRTVAVASSVTELRQKLQTISKDKMQIPEKRPEICFLFTGQGSQYQGMCKGLYESSPVFKMNFDLCDKLLKEKYEINLKPILWGEEGSQLSRSLYSQVAIFCVEYCLLKVWESWGVQPDAVIGHSLGEFTGAVCAGILSFTDALELVAQRSRLIEEKVAPGKMIVVKADKTKVDKCLEEFATQNKSLWLDYAAFNSPEQTVLAGRERAVEAFQVKCKELGLKTHVLEASSAFHSRDMEAIFPEYKKVAGNLQYSPPNVPYISGVTGGILEASEMNEDYWVRHVRDPVKFTDCSKVAEELGFGVFLEIGPQPVLCALTMANSTGTGGPIKLLPSLRKSESEWDTILSSLGKLYQLGFDIDWVTFDQFNGRKKVQLPTYPFARKTHWYEEKDKQNGDGMFVGSKQVHSLLGCQIPNATSNSIYQSSLKLEKLDYLKDHAIGNQILFPAAGFLEMCLSSGALSTTGQLDLVNPMSVENLTVEAPLSLGEVNGKDKQYFNLQTIVSKEDNEDNKISIYTRKNTSSIKWVRQAVGSFIPLQVNYRLREETQQLSDLQRRCTLEEETCEFYDRLSEVGLEFGNNFKSLRRLWRNSSIGTEILAEIVLLRKNETGEEYLAHPVVLDALIQTIMIGMGERIGKNGALYVPLVIGKTVLFSRPNGNKFYAHSAWKTDQPLDLRSATLYDENGSVLAIMEGVQLIETSAETIVKNLTSQNLVLPNMYEEIWRARMGPLKNRTDLEVLNGDNLFSTEFKEELSFCASLTKEQKEMSENRRRIVYLYILKSFYELGWKPELGQEINLGEFSSDLGVIPSLVKLINRYLAILQEEGILKKKDEDQWEIIKLPPNLTEINEGIQNCISFIESHPNETDDTKVFIACGEKLAIFLTGKESALSFLFPEDKTTTICAETFYNESITVNAAHSALKATVEKLMQNYVSVPEDQRGVLRFLEVGAGTGSTSKRVFPTFDEFKAKFQYTYTDISPAFFLKAQSMFESYGNKIQYKILNIEEDPMAQGFIPGHYDIVLASNVLHATKSLSESLKNVKSLLKEGGLLLMVETLQPIREYDVVFGFLDGFWRFDDFDIRPDYPTASGMTWEVIARKEGYDRFNYFPCFGGQVGVLIAAKGEGEALEKQSIKMEENGWWLVFSDNKVYPNHLKNKFEGMGRRVIEVKKGLDFKEENYPFKVRPGEKSDFLKVFKLISSNNLKIEGIAYLWGLDKDKDKQQDQVEITTGFLFLAQILLSEFKGLPKLVLVTEGMIPVGDESATDINPSSLWGMIRSFRTEHFNMHVRSVDLDPDEEEENEELKYSELFTEFWNDDLEFQIAYRKRSRHVCRLVQIKDFANPLTLPNSERYSLVLPNTKNIADLKFCPNGKQPLVGNEVDIQVRATGLNFRDVFVVLKPEKQFDSINCLGLEFAGVCVGTGPEVKHIRVGDNVMGCKFADGALPSHIQMEEDLIFKIPSGLTFCEAASIPAAFATAYHCLVTVAKLQAGETVLIHAGSGGVGLFAVQVAKAVGANIIATAGSRRKRAFLRNLGIPHVFHSRKTDYAKEIEKVTQGKGVQVILNSLTSPGFKEASLSVCSQNGRFIEMSKLHVWSEEEVKALRPDVKYTIVDLTSVPKSTWKTFWKAIEDYLGKDLLRPIPYVRFEGPFIRDALTYMQKAKHIGKIIVAMPELSSEGSTGRLEPVSKLFNEYSTYLITGGLGGIGIEVTKWMVKQGAKNIVLTSRRAPDENARKVIDNLNSLGKNIVPMSVDVGNFQSCEGLFKRIEEDKNLPTLRGIFHAAGTLSDATYVNQSVESFQTAFQGKVYGAWNLHQLSMGYPLEFFTMFSSMVSILGPIGLGNYAAANAYIDALCHYRYNLGLCSQTINWGQWNSVGAAKDLSMPAVKSFSPEQGLQALEVIMKTQKVQTAVLDVDFAYVRKLTSNVGTYLEELKITKGNQVAFTVKIGNFWEDFNACREGDEQLSVIKSYIGTILRQILKFDEDETIDENQNFSEMGMDSLMMLEMKNFLQTMLGKNITMNVSEMSELTTVHKLASHVLFLITKSSESSAGSEKSEAKSQFEFSPEVRNLIEEDMKLPENIKGASEGPCPLEKISTVLLTGATGKLGPYILDSLLKLTQIEKIYCLIRSQSEASARVRLIKSLQEKDLECAPNKLDLKVECLPGDVTDPWLGLCAEEYQKLEKKVDAVVHCAVKGNLMGLYVKPEEIKCIHQSKQLKNTIRQVNVIGTKNVLAFAASQKTKRVLHASTLLACHKVTQDDLLVEDWLNPKDVDEMTNVGYPVSKFICEILAKQANSRGIPVQVHRFPGLMGDQNGCFSFPNNHAMLRLLGFCKLGAMPEIPVPLQVLDVDFAAEMSIKLFFAKTDDSGGGVYNLTNPNINLLQDFPTIAEEFGFKIDVVEYEEFNRRLHGSGNGGEEERGSSVFPYREVDMEDGRYTEFTLSPNAMQCWNRNPDKFFISRKVHKVITNYNEIVTSPMDILRRDMEYAKRKGIFTKMKLT